MKRKIIVMVLSMLCTMNTFSRDYTLEDVLLIYTVAVEHYIIDFYQIFMTNPNQNSYIHYGEYKFDSYGNKILDDYNLETNDLDSTIYYKDKKIVGVRNGYNRWNYKIEGGNLIINHGREVLSYEMDYVSENELHCYGKKVTKNGNEFMVDAYEPYKFIFNEDSIEVIKLAKAGKELYKYIYDSHGILLKETDGYSNRSVSYSGVNGFVREEINSFKQIINDDYFRRIDNDGYLVYQNNDYSENNHYGFKELIILPCDDEDNILATVDEIAIPYPEKNEKIKENHAKAEDSGESMSVQRDQPDEITEKSESKNHSKLFQSGKVFLLFILLIAIISILILFRRRRHAKK